MLLAKILFAGDEWFRAKKLPKQVTVQANWTILHNVKYQYFGQWFTNDFQTTHDITLDVISQTGDQYQVISRSSNTVECYAKGQVNKAIHFRLNVEPFTVDKGSVIPIWGG